jgi:hypothetical protein
MRYERKQIIIRMHIILLRCLAGEKSQAITFCGEYTVRSPSGKCYDLVSSGFVHPDNEPQQSRQRNAPLRCGAPGDQLSSADFASKEPPRPCKHFDISWLTLQGFMEAETWTF